DYYCHSVDSSGNHLF
nr:immunoglobulin light chain junction region [Macaca mulatta]MOW71588.1 immunoglobulin light chain junction region [Macaca mulatta]